MGDIPAFLLCPRSAKSGATLRDTAGMVGGETSTAAAFESHLPVQTCAWTHRQWNPSLGEKKEARIGASVVISGSNGAPVLLDLPKHFHLLYLHISSEHYLHKCYERACFDQGLVKAFTQEDQAPLPSPSFLAIPSHTPVSTHTLNSGLYRKYD